MKRAAGIGAWLLGVLTVLLTLVPLWWWALFGLAEQTGDAFGITGFFTFMGALLCWAAYGTCDDDDDT